MSVTRTPRRSAHTSGASANTLSYAYEFTRLLSPPHAGITFFTDSQRLHGVAGGPAKTSGRLKRHPDPHCYHPASRPAGANLNSSPVHVTPAAPFDFALTIGQYMSHQNYHEPDMLRDGVSTRLLAVAGDLLLVSARSVGSVDTPGLEMTVSGNDVANGAARTATDRLAWTLGTAKELGKCYKMASEDTVMVGLVQRLYGLHRTRTASVFEPLATPTTAQQIASNVARIVRDLLVERYGRSLSVDGHIY